MKTKRNLLQVCLLCPVVLMLSPAGVQAQFTYTNADGSIYDYSINADGVSMTITGYTGPPWAVSIPSSINNLLVTGIGNGVSPVSSDSLTSLTIPNSVTSIGAGAFVLTGLTCVTIPGSVTNIGGSAFGGCYNLTNVTIPSSVTSIGAYAFTRCYDLTDVTLADGVSSLASYMFYMAGVHSVTIPGSVTNIGQGVFMNCDLRNVTICNGVPSIGTSMFEQSSLTSVTIPGSVTNIGDSAFFECTGLASVTIPASVTSIGVEAFNTCTRLTNVYFQGDAPSALTLEEFLVFQGDNNVTLYYLPGTSGWSSPFAGLRAMLWNPLIQNGDGSFGVHNNTFGFNITGTINIPIVVEACTNLANPAWTPLQTLNLTNGSFYFNDAQWTNYPEQFYRVRSP
jgi:hypothetical protein